MALIFLCIQYTILVLCLDDYNNVKQNGIYYVIH